MFCEEVNILVVTEKRIHVVCFCQKVSTPTIQHRELEDVKVLLAARAGPYRFLEVQSDFGGGRGANQARRAISGAGGTGRGTNELGRSLQGLPRGRKRRGWKKEFLESLSEAAKDIGEISEEEILRTVRTYRREKRAPEITVAAES